MKISIILCAIVGAVWCSDENSADNKANVNKAYYKRSLYSEGYGYGWPSYGGYDGWKGGDDGWRGSQIEITKEVPVIRPVAVAVPHPVPVAFPQPIPVHVPQPVPIHVPVAVPVLKTVPYPVEKPVPYPVEKPYPVEIIKKIPYPVPKPYPVHVPVYKVKHIFLQPTSNKWW